MIANDGSIASLGTGQATDFAAANACAVLSGST